MDGITSLRQRIVGKFLASKREKAGLSQQEVANHLGYSTAQFISNVERGVAKLPLHAMPKLAKLLGVSADEFISVICKYQKAVLALQKREIKAAFKR